MPRTLLLLIWFGSITSPAVAQLRDSFTDGDIASDPAWIGDFERWQIATVGGNRWLQTRGEARSDTIHISLKTDVSFGRWQFSFFHRGVNLSTFNGTRVFLSATSADPSSDISGYFLQIGTNNSDAVSLWRVDGDLSKRVELARSTGPLADGDSTYMDIVVQRSPTSEWSTTINGEPAFTANDGRYADGPYFMIWVKHTTQGADAFFFDDVSVDAIAEPPPPPPSTPIPQPGDIVINEIHYSPAVGGSEFIELYNRSDSTFDLQSLTFRDSQSRPIPSARSSSLLGPGAFAVIVADSEAFAAQFRQIPFVAPSDWASLNNGGDSVIIEAGGQSIDSIAYSIDATPRGLSLERVDPDAPSVAHNWAASRDPFGATPGMQNSTYAPDVQPPSLFFAEEIDALHVNLYFSEPLGPGSLLEGDVRIGGIPADTIALQSGSTYRASFRQGLRSHRVDVTSAVDQAGNTAEAQSTPIAFLPSNGDLVVNEIMYEPKADAYDGYPDQTEYVEIINRSERALTLRGLFRTRAADERGNADTMHVGKALVRLAPSSAALIASDSSARLLDGVELMIVAPELTLRNDGDLVRLHDAAGHVLDEVQYTPSWHHPDFLDTRGISLERIDVDGPSSDPENWTSSTSPSGGTPGMPNTVRLVQNMPARTGGVHIAPNPFSPDQDGRDDITSISYDLQSDIALVRIRIFDIHGRCVRELVPASLAAHEGRAYWDGVDDAGKRLRMGIYIVLLEAFAGDGSANEVYKSPVVLARKL